MAKEVTLDDLVKSSNNARPVTTTVEKTNKVESEKVEPMIVPSSGIKTAKPISTSDLGKNLQAQHPEAQKKVVEEDAPLVKNAFEAMDKTLAEKKRFITEEVMPIVMENAREMAMEKELGEDNEEVTITPSSNLFEDSDLDDTNEESGTNKDEGVYVAPTLPEIEKVEEILMNGMKQAAELAVTLEVEAHTGTNWYEAK